MPPRKSSIVKSKKAEKKARLLVKLRHLAISVTVLVVVLWASAWFFLSNADAQTAQWVNNKIVTAAADIGFRVENILVEGRENSDRDILLALINIQKGDPIFRFHPEEAKELIERLPWVKTAHVERRLPQTIYIGLTERQPMALLQKADKSIVLIDKEGEVLANHDLDKFRNLLMVSGDEAPAHTESLLFLLEAQPIISERVDTAQRIEKRRWNIKLKNGILVKLPEKDMELALQTLVKHQEEEGILDKNIKMIDLRDPARIVVQSELGQAMSISSGAGIPL